MKELDAASHPLRTIESPRHLQLSTLEFVQEARHTSVKRNKTMLAGTESPEFVVEPLSTTTTGEAALPSHHDN